MGDDHNENDGMLIILINFKYFNHELLRSDAIRDSDIECNNSSKTEDT